MKFPEPYKIADMAIRQINRKIIQLYSQVEDRLNSVDFDEVNVVSEFYELYKDIDEFVKRKLKELYELRYDEIIEYLIFIGFFDEDENINDTVDLVELLVFKDVSVIGSEVKEKAEIYVDELLEEPNPLTHYAYNTEILRKRDKAVEAVNSVKGKGNKREEISKHKRYISSQIIFYVDITSQRAELQAYIDAGVEKVQRHEMDDEKTCKECFDADGKIYVIDNIPPIPHLHCRRWFTPV